MVLRVLFWAYLSNLYSQVVSKIVDNTEEYVRMNTLLVFLRFDYADIAAMYFEKLHD